MKGIGVFFVEWQENFGANAKDVGWVGVIIGFFTSVGGEYTTVYPLNH